MGTRSMIAIQNPYNKQIKAVYCHWDGYLEHNGSLLQKPSKQTFQMQPQWINLRFILPLIARQ